MRVGIFRRLILLGISFVSLAAFTGKPSFSAENEFTLYFYYLPHRLTATSDKQYDLFLNEVFEKGDVQIKRQTAPLKRSSRNFRANPNSCVFPANKRALQSVSKKGTSDLISSMPLDIVSLRLYTREKSTGPVGVDDFAPERIGYIHGSGAIPLLGENAKRFIPIASEKQLIGMLELGRLDAFLGHHPDTALALDDLNKPYALHVTPLAILNLRFPVSFVCHDTKQARAFLAQLDPRIDAMVSSGRLQEILGQHSEIDQLESAARQEF
jgi:ABC-type amino acid transport substrate-binding protein